MPNYCANRLTLTGSFAKRQALVDQVKSEDAIFSFTTIVPEAPESDWYHWRIQHWGCKWDAGDAELEFHDEERTVYFFQTAWGPPNASFMTQMAAKFAGIGIDLRFAEAGMEFYGYWTPDKAETWSFQNDDVQEVEEEYHLRPGLELYADLYQRSG